MVCTDCLGIANALGSELAGLTSHKSVMARLWILLEALITSEVVKHHVKCNTY